MDIAIALPNMIPGTTGGTLLKWAISAEERGFTTLAVTERLVYPGYDPISVLSAAAAATTRVGLLTNVLIAPLRSPVELAKQAAGLDQLSGGRLVLGLAPGVRDDDFEAADRRFERRSERFDRDLETLHRIWADPASAGFDRAVAPPPFGGKRVPTLIGGVSAAAAERVARWADGWTAPGLTADKTAMLAGAVRSAWSRAGRAGRPRIVMLSRFALGDDVQERAAEFVRDYFAVLGGEAEEFVLETPRDARAVRQVLRVFADCGVDEVVFHPTVADPTQVDRLADIALP